jgi:hypothetical protein
MPLTRSVACLMWMRIQDLLVLLALGLLVWPGLPQWWRLGGLLAMLAGWKLMGLMVKQWWARHSTRPSPSQTGWRARAVSLMERLQHALLEPEHHHPLAWALTLANWSVKLAAGACLLSAVSGAPWLSAWAGALGGELIAIVPLQGPAGFGTYEAGVWAGIAASPAAHAMGGEQILEHTVTAALALHACFLLCAVLAGAGAAALSRAGKPALGHGRPPSRHPG